MMNKVRLTMVQQTYELELTPALKSNLLGLGKGLVPPSTWLQIHDEEWINLTHVVSFQFYQVTSTPIDISSSGGHVYDVATHDEGWKPNQRGGVVTAEPDVVRQARERGDTETTDNGGDM